MRHLAADSQMMKVCEQCEMKEQIESKLISPRRVNPQIDLKVLIVDCRIEGLQKESKLPICMRLDIKSDSKLANIVKQCERIYNYKNIYHIFLVGLDICLDEKPQRGMLKQFHTQILRLIMTELLSKGFSYVSVLVEGYQACHDLALLNDLELVDHPSTNAITSQLSK